jgi:hypothetical protein
MDTDPGQMNNLLSVPSSIDTTKSSPSAAIIVAGYPLNKIVSRLDSLLLVLKSCKGAVCREPWKALHPKRDVKTLKEALSSKFDDFYQEQQTRVAFDYCWNGYVPEAEGSMWEKDGLLFRDGLPWHVWT